MLPVRQLFNYLLAFCLLLTACAANDNSFKNDWLSSVPQSNADTNTPAALPDVGGNHSHSGHR